MLKQIKQYASHAATTVSPGATDQAFFQEIGVQTVIYGPGEFDLAHTTDESVAVSAIEAALAVYRQVIAHI